jgi:hypothetical protein
LRYEVREWNDDVAALNGRAFALSEQGDASHHAASEARRAGGRFNETWMR